LHSKELNYTVLLCMMSSNTVVVSNLILLYNSVYTAGARARLLHHLRGCVCRYSRLSLQPARWQLDIKLNADIWPSARMLIRPARPERTWPRPEIVGMDPDEMERSKVRTEPEST